MKHNIKCSICGNLFNNRNDNAKYCSAECKVEGAKRARKTWEAENPGYMKTKMREYRANKPPLRSWKP